MSNTANNQPISFEDFKAEVLADYKLCEESRELSLVGRKEVLSGKAKFGIFGAGKELPQVALCKFFQNGDFRSGYYRDQTMALATGNATLKSLFAQLYADTNLQNEPMSGGRMMNSHFANRLLDEHGMWKDQTKMKNFAADTSPTASQMPKALGLALASKLYRQNAELKDLDMFSINGNEVAFATIGDASTSEGIFWETMNAACVMQVPLIVSVWDDGYGISVPKKYQTAKSSISEALSGMQSDSHEKGMDIYKVHAWNYVELVNTYKKAVEKSRTHHTPALIHVIEVTQPIGHSTSGSHERYKDKDRLEFEVEKDCILHFRQWILDNKLATAEELDEIRKQATEAVKSAKNEAYEDFLAPVKELKSEVEPFIAQILEETTYSEDIKAEVEIIRSPNTIFKREIIKAVHSILDTIEKENLSIYNNLKAWYQDIIRENQAIYSSHLYSQSTRNAMMIEQIEPNFEGAEEKTGHDIINTYFDIAMENFPELTAFGEDVGKIGDVNQGFAGLQDKYGKLRVFDTGIREATIMGQGYGMSIRGLRPIAEIQYLDYLLYGLQVLSDEVATMQYRTRGGQKAPMIVRSRGHRLEGIWHSGSPMGMIINSLRGMYVCVPRNFTQAAGMYQTILNSDEPALIIEPLNGYRLKESMPSNIGKYTIPMGKVETMRSGADLTMVSYGSTLRICQEACDKLAKRGIDVELIDIQTFLPFDLNRDIVESVKKTNRLVIVDEDVPGGGSAFILQKLIEEQDIYHYLDSKPLTIAGKEHRPAYGSDGDYFSKPNLEEIYDKVLNLMREAKPSL